MPSKSRALKSAIIFTSLLVKNESKIGPGKLVCPDYDRFERLSHEHKCLRKSPVLSAMVILRKKVLHYLLHHNAPGGGRYMTCGWMGVCHPVFRKLPSSNYDSCRHTHFYVDCLRKLPLFDNFLPIWKIHPCLRKICQKRDPCLEIFGPKTHQYGWHIPAPLNISCYPPPGTILDLCRNGTMSKKAISRQPWDGSFNLYRDQ